MLRAYAIAQGASTQALFGIAWMIIFGTEPAGFMRDVFMVLCWLLNMLAAEIFIHQLNLNMRSSAPAHIEARKHSSGLSSHEF